MKMKVMAKLAVLMLLCTAIAPIVTAVLDNHVYPMPVMVLDIVAAVVAVASVVVLVIVGIQNEKLKKKAMEEEIERRLDDICDAHHWKGGL